MGTITELRRARQAVYLQALVQTGRVTDAVDAAGIDPTLPWRWRQRYPDFAVAEQQAKAQAAQRLVHGQETP